MPTAVERAEARRKAILSRGSDRLSKLTTSARGEGAPAYLSDSPRSVSSTLRNFVGEESEMPTPSPQLRRVSLSPSPSPSPAPGPSPPHPLRSQTHRSTSDSFASLLSESAPDPSVWTEEQQRQFLSALMGGVPQSQPLPGMQTPPLRQRRARSEPPAEIPLDNPLAALLAQQAGFSPDAGVAILPPEKPPTRLQKLMPFVHFASMWALLAYFVFYHEPTSYQGSADGMWQRWAELGSKSPASSIVTIDTVPFFWAFTTLEIVLHSIRIFSGFNAVQPPTIIALALPHLPAPLPSIIVNTMKYFQMASLFLNDIAALIVGVGFIIVYARWFGS
ncbi:hypothetical protein AX16_009927 [Volvariella volvacea WC 439]|nr:hypothetical protein AX16_009927 [Volvariella volvacea WC 439]